MEVVPDTGPFPPLPRGSIVTIGAYDGVHLGHRAVIGEVRVRAAALGCASVVVTFDRYPARVVRPESAPLQLTDPDQKLELLAATGIDYAVVVHFDEARAQESAEDFVTDMLVGALNVRGLIVGHDFHFGHGRRGNVALLSDMGRSLGFDVMGMHLVADESAGQVVSSTRIRQLLGAGDVEGAAALLGRPHEVRGRVEKGGGRGTAEVRYPTANVAVPEDILLPADGIYGGWYLRPDGSMIAAVISLGVRPGVHPDGGDRLVEAHLLDFSGDLYGEAARVRFVRRIRDEERFGSVGDLVERMRLDVEDVRTALRPRPGPA